MRAMGFCVGCLPKFSSERGRTWSKYYLALFPERLLIPAFSSTSQRRRRFRPLGAVGDVAAQRPYLELFAAPDGFHLFARHLPHFLIIKRVFALLVPRRPQNRFPWNA